MTKALQGEKGKDGQPFAGPTLYRIQFVERTVAGQTVVMEFADPVPCKAVCASACAGGPADRY